MSSYSYTPQGIDLMRECLLYDVEQSAVGGVSYREINEMVETRLRTYILARIEPDDVLTELMHRHGLSEPPNVKRRLGSVRWKMPS